MTPSRILYLLPESKKDAIIVQTILTKKGYSVQIKHRGDERGSISTLARDIERLVKSVLLERAKSDQKNACIVVLHDADFLTRPTGRVDYDKIQAICHQYNVVHLIAHDEIESWLLADAGLCAWLNTRPQNQDNIVQPSKRLETLLNKANKPRWSVDNAEKIVAHMDASGDQPKRSPSMQKALQDLRDGNCLPASPPEPRQDMPPFAD